MPEPETETSPLLTRTTFEVWYKKPHIGWRWDSTKMTEAEAIAKRDEILQRCDTVRISKATREVVG